MIFTGHGLAVEIDESGREAEALASNVPPGFQLVSSAAEVGHRYRLARAASSANWELYEDGVCIAQFGVLHDIARFFNRRVAWNAAVLGADCTFIHAGAVAIDGRALILPGHSGAGKSTLVAALLERGAAYLSDEYALVDEAGAVHAFPRDLAFDVAGGGSVDVSPDALGASPLGVAQPCVIVLTTFVADHGLPSLEVLTPAAAVAALIPHTVSCKTDPAKALRRLERLVHRSTCYQAKRGEARAAAAALAHLVQMSVVGRQAPPAR